MIAECDEQCGGVTMEYGRIPGVEKPISRLVQGTIPLSEADRAGSFALLDAVYEIGCRTFDTAYSYGAGEKERVLSAWLADRGVRDQIVTLGKGAHPEGGRPRVTPQDITHDLNESLRRLDTDHIEIYVLHRDNPALPVGPIVDVLNEHHRAGKIGVFGGSNWTHERVREANEYAAVNGLVPFGVSSPNFSLAEQFQPPWAGCITVSGPAGAVGGAGYRAPGLPLSPGRAWPGASSRGVSAARTSIDSARISTRSASRRTATSRTSSASIAPASWRRSAA